MKIEDYYLASSINDYYMAAAYRPSWG